MSDQTKELLNENEVQREYGLNARTLQRERSVGTGVPYVKMGRRVLYKRTDLDKFIEKHTVGDYRYD